MCDLCKSSNASYVLLVANQGISRKGKLYCIECINNNSILKHELDLVFNKE